MTEHSLICSGESVRGILDGRKTQTRRVIKPQPVWAEKQPNSLRAAGWKWETKKARLSAWPDTNKFFCELVQYCPYGKVGDRLGVKEGFQITGYSQSTCRLKGTYLSNKKKFPFCKITKAEWNKWENRKHQFSKTSARFMYKSLTRIWLEITNIKVERVQDISLDDVYNEGIQYDDHCGRGHLRDKFKSLWDSLNTKRGYGWDKNPFVRVLEFKRIEETR